MQAKKTRKSTNRLAQVTKAVAMLDSGSVTKDRSSHRLTTSYFSKHLKVSGYVHTQYILNMYSFIPRKTDAYIFDGIC